MENLILDNITDLHTAIYNKVFGLTLSIPGLSVLGYESSRQYPELPQRAVKVLLREVAIDRRRPTPRLGNNIALPSGTPIDLTYNGVLYPQVYPELTYKFPLPVLLTYELDCWAHDAVTQLTIDQGILQMMPERGCLFLNINLVDYALPITLIAIETLDDYQENFRERLYIYNIEAYVKSWVPDEIKKIITNPITEIYKGNKPEDALSKNLLDIVELKPE